MGIGDWGWGMGDWGLAPIPTPQSPIPNPQSPIPNPQSPFVFKRFILIFIKLINKKLNFLIFIQISKNNKYFKFEKKENGR